MNVIDTLIVTLGLDATEFKKGTQEANKAQTAFINQSRSQGNELEAIDKKNAEAQKARFREIESQSKIIAQGFAKIRNQALSMLAVFTAGKGLSNFTSDTIQSSAELDRLSENLGIGAERLNGYALAAKNAGGTAQGMFELLQRQSKAAADFKMGMPNEDINAFFQWGGRYGAKADDFKDAETLLLAKADILHEAMMKQGEQEALAIADRMGINREQYNLLKMGSVALKEKRDGYAKLTGLTKEQTEELGKLAEKWNNLSASFEGTGKIILSKLEPQIESLIDNLMEFSNWLRSDDVENWFSDAVKEVDSFLTKIEELLNVPDKFGAMVNEVFESGAPDVVKDAANAVTDAVGMDGETKHDKAHAHMSLKDAAWNYRGGEIMGLNDHQTRALAAETMKHESSGGDLRAENKYGYIGKYQFGADALADAGLVDLEKLKAAKKEAGKGWFKGGQAKFLHNNENWTTEGGFEGFMRSGELQDRAFAKNANMNIQTGVKSGALKASSSPEDISGFVMAAHLKGAGAAINLYKNGKDSSDANGTKASQYAQYGRDIVSLFAGQPQQQSAAIQSPARQAINAKHESTTNSTVNSHNSNVTSETNIQNVNIQTAATDPAGIAKEIVPEIQRQTLVFNAASGMRQ
ncbi:hypothetical protein [Methylobacter luteus]|uniref:hypothetical protein n=1 Tax=Methylobacter luteus TaxID=415 RepID=UPI000418B41E|nr:hypothetical protein [Methylobacter luteus]